MLSLTAVAVLSSFFAFAHGHVYSQTESYIGRDFLSGFTHQAISDPTHGRVNYVDQATALAQNLTFASDDHFLIRADHKTVLSASGPGRNSVRIQSRNTYTKHVSVWKIRHIPAGCGTWPAIWTVGSDWPNNGEIDIVEGVNDVGPNRATLHTNAGCTMPDSRSQTGSSAGNNCDVVATGNSGCGVSATANPNSFGSAFNYAGGGFYAMQRTNTFIKIWFWSIQDNVPSDVLNGESTVNTSNWGTPMAYFPNTSCDLAAHFGPHNIIINLTLCGDWAGSAFNADGCPGDCVTYVNENPGDFNRAYFDIHWLKIYE